MSQRIKFVPPIELPNGRKLVTIEDAGRYIMALPDKTRAKPEWDLAGRQIVDVIHGRSVEMMARMAFMRALKGLKPGAPDIK